MLCLGDWSWIIDYVRPVVGVGSGEEGANRVYRYDRP